MDSCIFSVISIVIIVFLAWKYSSWKPTIEETPTTIADDSFNNITINPKIEFDILRNKIDSNLKQFGFVPVSNSFVNDNIKRVCFWKKKNLNINRSVVLMEINSTIDFSELVNFVHKIKIDLGKETGYIPFLYEVGMQIIVIANLTNNINLIRNPVDAYSNQRALIQSVFIIDNLNNKYYKSATWLQYISGKFQAAIDLSIKEIIEEKTNVN